MFFSKVKAITEHNERAEDGKVPFKMAISSLSDHLDSEVDSIAEKNYQHASSNEKPKLKRESSTFHVVKSDDQVL